VIDSTVKNCQLKKDILVKKLLDSAVSVTIEPSLTFSEADFE